MILLDTDTLSLFHAGNETVVDRVAKVDADQQLGTTIITRAEILRARFAFLLKAADGDQLQRAQERLYSSDALLADLYIADIDAKVAFIFDELCERKKLKKIGLADLLIASITLANDALLVTRNLRHFRQVPNLRLENWAD